MNSDTILLVGGGTGGHVYPLIAVADELKRLASGVRLVFVGTDESQRMVRLLRTLRRHHTIVLVEHDMDVVFALADRISVMVYGRVIASGAPDTIRANPEVRRAYLGEDVTR